MVSLFDLSDKKVTGSPQVERCHWVMRISEERIAALARQICNGMLDEDLIDLEISEERFYFLIEQLILQDIRMEDKIDEEAAARLRKQKPYLQDGTPDWEVALEKVKDDLAKSKGYVIR